MQRPDDLYARLLWGLRSALRAAGMPQRVVAERLGLSLSHTSRLLRGADNLKAEQLFPLLGAVDVHPPLFFHHTFRDLPEEAEVPDPGDAPEGREEGREAGGEQGKKAGDGASVLRQFLLLRDEIQRRKLAAVPVDLPGEPRRLARYLKERIRRSGFRTTEVSREMGLAPGHFGQALRGNQRLSMPFLFQALAVIEKPPLGFFHGFYGLEDEDRGEWGLRRGQDQ